jgi:hypothetical protein
MSEEKNYDWEATKEQIKINIEYAIDIIDEYFGDAITARKDDCAEERLLSFQEILRLIMPTALIQTSAKEETKVQT